MLDNNYGRTGKIISEERLGDVLARVDRVEREKDTLIYMRAVRATFYALGYDHDWCYSTGPYRGKGLDVAMENRWLVRKK